MSDLISRKVVLDIINKHRCDTARIEEGVLNLPTAYDVDKVVEQLEEERDLSLKSAGKYYHKPLVRAHYQNAISIVKGGGQG